MHAMFEEEIALAEKQLHNLKSRYNLFKSVYNSISVNCIIFDVHTKTYYRVIDKSDDKIFVAMAMDSPHIKKVFFYLAQNWVHASNKYHSAQSVSKGNVTKQSV